MTKYQKKVILFPAGASGNFLSEFLTTGKIFAKSQVRIDLGQTVSSALVVPSDLEKIKNAIVNGTHQTVLSHYNEISKLREFETQCWIRKIYPYTDLFGWLKNVFYKKQMIEKVDYSQAEMLTQFDAMFENMKHFYFLLKNDTDLPGDLTIDFGQIKNLNYLKQLYIDANGTEPMAEHMDFAQDYISKQGKIINDCKYTDIEHIAKLIEPQDLYEVAILLFVYEKNHNTIDCNRLWTINDLPVEIDSAIKFLVDNSKNYSIFK